MSNSLAKISLSSPNVLESEKEICNIHSMFMINSRKAFGMGEGLWVVKTAHNMVHTCFRSASEVLITVNRQCSSLLLMGTDVTLNPKRNRKLPVVLSLSSKRLMTLDAGGIQTQLRVSGLLLRFSSLRRDRNQCQTLDFTIILGESTSPIKAICNLAYIAQAFASAVIA